MNNPNNRTGDYIRYNRISCIGSFWETPLCNTSNKLIVTVMNKLLKGGGIPIFPNFAIADVIKRDTQEHEHE